MMSKTTAQAAEILEGAPTPPPRVGRPPIDLSTPTGVLNEIGRLYKDARHGRLEVGRATKLVYILNSALKAHQTVSLERRVAALEADDGLPVLIDPDPDI